MAYTTDPVAEAAFIVCEVLGLRPAEFDSRRATLHVWVRISGTATISQNAPRVIGPSA